jgi:uncharacterized protein (DUF1684 family)
MQANVLIRVYSCAFVAIALLAADDYTRGILEWRAQREAKLKADDGWLTVVGLHWLKEGDNRVGSNPDFEVPLPKLAPDRFGTLTLKAGKVQFTPTHGTPRALKPDTDILTIGAIKFYVIKRDDRLGVRVKDNNSAARREFKGLKWYPVDPSWRIRARFVKWDKPHPLTFDTAVGVKERMQSDGYVTFQHDGKEYRLEPVTEGDKLWFVMRDQTSGKTTYAASRFLYVDLPREDGSVDLDFNRAENPPCVFTDFATCPLPLPQNRLPFAVTAGEQMYGGHH